MMRRGSAVMRAVRASALVLVLVACGGGYPGVVDGPGTVALPTPVESLSSVLAGTVAVLTDALASAGYQLYAPLQPYRPAEPTALAEAPRTVLQVSGPDPDQGFVVVYELPDAAAAMAAGGALASYLGSGFGQTNFPLDAQFSVAQQGSSLIFTWWSAARSADRTHAEGAFDTVRSVGVQVPVLK
jgi:hypothetical protein